MIDSSTWLYDVIPILRVVTDFARSGCQNQMDL